MVHSVTKVHHWFVSQLFHIQVLGLVNKKNVLILKNALFQIKPPIHANIYLHPDFLVRQSLLIRDIPK